MTIALKFYSAAGKLQASHTHMVPQFVGKFPAVLLGPDIAEGAEDGLLTRAYYAPNVISEGRDMIIYWYIPQGCWAFAQSTYLNGVSSGASIGLYLFVPPGTVINDPPVAYVFAINRVIRSPDAVALRMWNDSNELMFDSGTLHLSVEQVITDMAYPEVGTQTSAVSLPARPGFLFSSMYRDLEDFPGIFDSPGGFSHFKEWMGCLKRVGDTVMGREVLVYDDTEWAASDSSRTGYLEDQRYGKSTNMVIPVIDTTLYD